MEKETLHNTSYGWNYGYIKSKAGKIRPFRYFTNGHVNSDSQYGVWTVWTGEITQGVLEQLLHNGKVSY